MRRAQLRIVLYGVGVLLMLLAGYRAFFSVPASRVSMPQLQVPATDVTPEMYHLAPGEVLRFLPRPPREVRRAICLEVGLPASEADHPLISLSLRYDGELHFWSVTKGYGYTPRPLTRVIAYSLDIPLWRIRGIDVAQRIGLSGDWVVRSGAKPEAVMEALVPIVRRAGYPGFRVVPLRMTVRGVVLRGQPRRYVGVVDVLPKVDASVDVAESDGDAATFACVLSNAIERPVRWEPEPPDVTIHWRDHSLPRRAEGLRTTETLVRRTLDAIAARLDIAVAYEPVEATIWELRLDAVTSP